jgi:6-pyruvoyltetrahydropterin/6-carboxytetrahydropterin synthase
MSKKIFYSTKTYGNDRGLSCCFRQWRSTHSHCSLWHGYSIGIKLVFGCDELDERNWVFDFGGLKDFKQWAEHMFDHTLAIAEDDPHKDATVAFAKATGIADIRIVPGVGCERFAELCFDKMTSIIDEGKANGTLLNPTVFLDSVEVFEHGANSAICKRDAHRVFKIEKPDGISVDAIKEYFTSLKDVYKEITK